MSAELAVVEAAPVKPLYRKQCHAVDAGSGSRCKLLEGHVGPHGCERGQFVATLAEGFRPAREQQLKLAALRQEQAGFGLELTPGRLDSSRHQRARKSHQCAGCGRQVNGAAERCFECRKSKASSIGQLQEHLGAYPSRSR
jgi:hypothetical protein